MEDWEDGCKLGRVEAAMRDCRKRRMGWKVEDGMKSKSRGQNLTTRTMLSSDHSTPSSLRTMADIDSSVMAEVHVRNDVERNKGRRDSNNSEDDS